MVNLKTKTDKHAYDNEKRCKSIKNKEKLKINQSKIIKEAILNSSLGSSSNKKIIFNDEYNDNGTDIKETKTNNLNKNGKSTLFESSDSENETFEIKEKTQFAGAKGFELLNLQSTYGNDERFRIDERFLDAEPNEISEEKNSSEKNVALEEKNKQLKILESVLGTSLTSPEKEKTKKNRTYEMIRYDVSNKDHKIYEKSIQNETKSLMKLSKRKGNRKAERTDYSELTKPNVSKDKFYEVSSDVKNSFKEKQNSDAKFSLLQTYGANERDVEINEQEIDNENDNEFEESFDKEHTKMNSDFEEAVQKEEEMVSQEPTQEIKSATAKGIWKESFFFVPDDERFKEGLEFINKKGTPEAEEAAENYDQARKKLREILRLHVKKQMHKNDPFKNKIGGMNKKQLANTKFKASKVPYNKKRIQKKSSAWTT